MGNEFPYQEIRALFLEYLKSKPTGQFTDAVSGIVNLAKGRGMYSGQDMNHQYRRIGGANYDLRIEDRDKVPETVRQLFWEFLVKGILVFGMDDMNPNWPWYKVTDYGMTITNNQSAQPYDPDGFLREFITINPNADKIVINYLEEAVHSFNAACFKASAVMLGCASEQLILNLHESFENAIKDKTIRDRFIKSYGRTIYTKFASLRNGLETMIDNKQLPKDLQEAVKSDLVSCFELIRRQRNSAGHPELPSDIRRETIFLNLTVFSEYVRQLIRIATYFETNEAIPI